MKKFISILLSLSVLFSSLLFFENGTNAATKVYNAFDDFDIQKADGTNVPWIYLYSEDEAKSFFPMSKTADVVGIKWYPPKGSSTNTALGFHEKKISTGALIIDSTPANSSMAVLGFVAPEDGFYDVFAQMHGHHYDGQKGESFYIYKNEQIITSMPFGDDRKVYLEYDMEGAIELKKGDRIYFYQKSENDMHHSGFINAIVEGPIDSYSGKIFIPGDSNEPTKEPEDESVYFYMNLGMSPGKDQSEMNFNWLSKPRSEDPIIQIVEQKDYENNGFNSDNVISFLGSANTTFSEYDENKVTVSELFENKKYFYRISSMGSNFWSDTYCFETRDSKDYEFVFLSDPQIGASGDINKDTENFIDTLNKASTKTPNASFVLSGGDQVEHGLSIDEFNGFFSPTQFRNIPVAIAVGNHENWSLNSSILFNVPNKIESSSSDFSSSYYFSYGETLFIVLDSNNESADDHREVFERAISSHENAKWKVVMMHHNMYSSGYWYANSPASIRLRERFFPLMDEFGIDVVLNGHDHSYARSKFMYNNEPINNQLKNEDESYIHPDGTIYITANSSTGSKYYELTFNSPKYIEARHQSMTPTFTKVLVNETEFTLETYKTDNMELVDSITIQKEVSTKEEFNVFIEKAEKEQNLNYDTTTWNMFLDILADAKSVLNDENSTSEDFNIALNALLKAQYNLRNSVVDKSELSELISFAENLNNLSEEGDEFGLYEIGAKKELEKVINKAKGVLNKEENNKIEVEEMIQELDTAISRFRQKKIQIDVSTIESIEYNAYDDYNTHESDSSPWQYLYKIENSQYLPLRTFELNGWRVSDDLWAGVAKNSDMPGLIELNTGYGGEHIGVLAFVAPVDGIYKINEILAEGNMWEQQVDKFFIIFEDELLQSRKFSDTPEESIAFYEYIFEMNEGEKLYFYATKTGDNASVYTNIIVEQLIVPQDSEDNDAIEDNNLNFIQKLIIIIAISVLVIILGGSIAYITVKYKGKSNK